MNNKKTIIILILFIGIIGLTIAYFSNSTTIDNLFSTKEYGSTITETFTSPNNWLPGDTTEKKVVATNTGEVDQAVRISYTEKWLDSNNNELNGWIHEDGSKSSHETEEELSNDERVALINFDNNDDWTYNNGFYYYNYRLQPNESTSSLIKSVSFNSKTKLDDTCTTTISEGKKTITCNSSGDNYDGATYTLTFKIETVQYDKYMNAWNTDVAILNEQALFCDAFEVGEVVEYNNADYYVLKDSSTSDDYVTLLKKDPLTASEVNQYSTDYVSQDGEYPYFESDTCNENNQTGCSTNYDTSDVKKIVDGWSSSFSNDLVSIDGYKTRLVSFNDMMNNLGYTYVLGYMGTSYSYEPTRNTPEWVYTNYTSSFNYWMMTSYEDSNEEVFISTGQFNGYDYGSASLSNTSVFNYRSIRPVINLKKSAINDSCIVGNNVYLTCTVGDEVTYDNELYYVIKNSESSRKTVTLLKANLLTKEEVNEYSVDYISQDGEYPYLENDICNENDKSGCSNKYDISNIKLLVDNWSDRYSNDLVNIDGYKARLINENDAEYNLGYNKNEYRKYESSSRTPTWVLMDGEPYWTMIKGYSYYTGYEILAVNSSKSNIYNYYDKNYVRPVINLKKSAIESGCSKESYVLGEKITYNNESYCVISNSNEEFDYLTLIKQDPLTCDELVTYNNGYEISRDSVDNDIGIISYYKSDTCYYNSNSDNNKSGCSSDYNNSFIKNVVNSWSNSILNDLKEVDGYKVRLITNNELNNMGHIYHSRTSSPVITKSSYDCLYSDEDYWTMSTSSDSNNAMDIVSKTEGKNGPELMDKQYAVRPVINLKKCALTNTCE